MDFTNFIAQHHDVVNIILGIISGILISMAMFFLIGRKRVKWLIWELIKLYSSTNSFFSKKRIESGIAFIIAESGAIFWLLKKYDDMTTSDFIMWLSPQLFVAGWMISQIQREKTTNVPTNLNDAKKNENSEDGPVV